MSINKCKEFVGVLAGQEGTVPGGILPGSHPVTRHSENSKKKTNKITFEWEIYNLYKSSEDGTVNLCVTTILLQLLSAHY